MDSSTTDTATAPETATVLDKSAIRGARRLAAWGPGAFVKREGVWRTRRGGFVAAMRDAAGDSVRYREVGVEEAADILREHGHAWRAHQLLAPEEDAGAIAEGGDAEDGDAEDDDEHNAGHAAEQETAG